MDRTTLEIFNQATAQQLVVYTLGGIACALVGVFVNNFRTNCGRIYAGGRAVVRGSTWPARRLAFGPAPAALSTQARRLAELLVPGDHWTVDGRSMGRDIAGGSERLKVTAPKGGAVTVTIGVIDALAGLPDDECEAVKLLAADAVEEQLRYLACRKLGLTVESPAADVFGRDGRKSEGIVAQDAAIDLRQIVTDALRKDERSMWSVKSTVQGADVDLFGMSDAELTATLFGQIAARYVSGPNNHYVSVVVMNRAGHPIHRLVFVGKFTSTTPLMLGVRTGQTVQTVVQPLGSVNSVFI